MQGLVLLYNLEDKHQKQIIN